LLAYFFTDKVRIEEILDGRLEKCGIREHIDPYETSGHRKWLTDGRGVLELSVDEKGFVWVAACNEEGAGSEILKHIAQAFPDRMD
jgi:hypothetical protein